MPTPIVACLHNLEDAFTGHAGDAMRDAESRFAILARDGEALLDVGDVDGVARSAASSR